MRFYLEGHHSTIPLVEWFKQAFQHRGIDYQGVSVKYFKQARPGELIMVSGTNEAAIRIMRECETKQIPFFHIDKGYIRNLKGLPRRFPMFYKFAFNHFHPTSYFQNKPKPPDRWEALGIEFRHLSQGDYVLFAGSSQRYCTLFDLGDASEYAQQIFRKIKKLTQHPILYRPKPSWKAARPIDGTVFSNLDAPLFIELEKSFCLVTHGSGAAIEAILSGIPVIMLGDGIAKPMSGTSLKNLIAPALPSDEKRWQWCCDLAYCQWSHEEIVTGQFIDFFNQEFEAY